VAIERWQQFSGVNAVLAGTGETFAELKAKRLAARTRPRCQIGPSTGPLHASMKGDRAVMRSCGIAYVGDAGPSGPSLPMQDLCCACKGARQNRRILLKNSSCQVARDIAKTRQYDISMKLRKKVEMLFAHLKRILGLSRLRLRGPSGANWRRSFPHRSKREKPDRKGARCPLNLGISAVASGRFSTESAGGLSCSAALAHLADGVCRL
jgi:hypothetical protein